MFDQFLSAIVLASKVLQHMSKADEYLACASCMVCLHTLR